MKGDFQGEVYSAYLVEDDVRSANALTSMLNTFSPDIRIEGVAHDLASAESYLSEHTPQLLFLDVELPDGKGFELFDLIPDLDCVVIFVTAFDDYALEAIKCSAVDYLLKPLDVEDLEVAIDRAKKRISEKAGDAQKIRWVAQAETGPPQRLVVPDETGFRFINVDDIVRCEASGNYTVFHMENGEKILVSRILKEYDELLRSAQFVRVHSAHLVNLKYVDRYVQGRGGYVVLYNGDHVNVAARRKDEFIQSLKGR